MPHAIFLLFPVMLDKSFFKSTKIHQFLHYATPSSGDISEIMGRPGWNPTCEAPPGFYFCIFGPLTRLKKPVFIKLDLLPRKVPAMPVTIPALLYVGKGPVLRPFSYTKGTSSISLSVKPALPFENLL
jgi:hypothetical protein